MKIKQLLTIFGILILLASIGLGGYFAYTNGLIVGKTDPSIQPLKIKITNINHDRFSVSWITQEPANGSIIYGVDSKKFDQLQIEDNDQLSGQQIARRTHHITLTNLDPETNYYFKIRSGEKNTIFDDNGKAFSIITAPVLSAQPPADLINGSVILNNKPAVDAIVYISLPGTSSLSTQVKKDGTWLANLAIARTIPLTEYATYDNLETSYNINIQGDNISSEVILTTANDSPVPDIVLGETYDFTKQIAQATPMPSPTPMPAAESTPSAKLASQFPLEPDDEASPDAKIPEQNPIGTSEVEISNPFEEYEELHTQTPEFHGTGPVGTVLTLMVSGVDEISTSVTVANDGNWRYTPPQSLSVGDYLLRISYVNDNDDTQSLERNFSIAASSGTGGNVPSYTASTSATKATPTPTVAPRKSMPSTASGTPESGFELPTIMLLLLGFGLTITGLGWKKRLAN